jgi:hypothetical protein
MMTMELPMTAKTESVSRIEIVLPKVRILKLIIFGISQSFYARVG